jgi:DNA modification methylase
MKVDLVPIDSIVGYIRNPRRNAKSIPKVKSSLKEFGWRQPIVVDRENVIVVGHTRWLAAKELGMTMVPVHVAEELTPAQAKAYRIADNRSGQDSEFDNELLVLEFGDLKDYGFDLQLTGFDTPELDALLKTPLEIKEDQTEHLADKSEDCLAKWGVEVGQFWKCGEHLLYCGDCDDREAMKLLLAGVKVDLLLTDPPYGVDCEKFFPGNVKSSLMGNDVPRRHFKADWDTARPSQETLIFLRAQAEEAILFGGNFFADILPMSTHWIVWDKHQTMPSYGDCELAWTSFQRKSVVKYDCPYNGLIGKEKERFHPTQKPVKLFAQIIDDYTDVGGVILDPYGGSGTTLIAAEQAGRVARMIDREPKYVATMLERWAQLTEGQPELWDGQPD